VSKHRKHRPVIGQDICCEVSYAARPRDLGQAIKKNRSDPSSLHPILDKEGDFGDVGSSFKRKVAADCDDLLIRPFTLNDDKRDMSGPIDSDQLVEQGIG
jgi:hypothetical protein